MRDAAPPSARTPRADGAAPPDPVLAAHHAGPAVLCAGAAPARAVHAFVPRPAPAGEVAR